MLEAMADEVHAADEVPWLDHEQLGAWMYLVAMVEALPAALDAQLKRDAGINRFEYMILVGLSDSPDHTMAMSQLALAATGSLSRLSHAVSRLESKGWVERRPAGTGRQMDVRLTATGLARLQEIAPGHVREARRLVVDVLERDELLALGRSARTVLQTVSPDFVVALEDAHRRMGGLPHMARGGEGA